jgi:hypothetical protein
MHVTPRVVGFAFWMFLLMFARDASAQGGVTEQIRSFQAEKNDINRTAMLVLGSWAVGNIIVGTYGNFTATGQAKYFHQFNALWNVVNLGIAGFSLLTTAGTDLSSMSALDILKDHTSFQSFLLLNAGLDLAYMSFGLYLKERSKTSSSADRLRGYGNGLLLQGAFLLAFDLVLYFVHEHNAAVQLYPSLDPVLMGTVGIGARIQL